MQLVTNNISFIFFLVLLLSCQTQSIGLNAIPKTADNEKMEVIEDDCIPYKQKRKWKKYFECQIDLARKFIRKKKYEKAISILDTTLVYAKSPIQNLEAYKLLINCYKKQKNFEGFISTYLLYIPTYLKHRKKDEELSYSFDDIRFFSNKKGFSYIPTIKPSSETYLLSFHDLSAQYFFFKKDYQVALNHYTQVEELMKKRKFLGTYILDIYKKQMNCNKELGNYEATKIACQKILMYYKKFGEKTISIGESYYLLGLIEIYFENPESALPHFQQSLIHFSENYKDLDIYKFPNKDNFKNLSAELLSTINYKAEIFYDIYSKYKSIKNLEASFHHYYLLIPLVDEFRSKLSTINEGKPLDFYKYNDNLYLNALSVALEIYERTSENDYKNKALEIILRSKVFTLRKSIQELHGIKFAGIPDSLIAEETRLKKAINTEKVKLHEKEESEELKNLKNQHKNLLITFERQYPKYYQLKHSNSVSKVEDIQQSIDSSTAILEYLFAGDTLYIATITKDTLIIIETEVNDTLFNSYLGYLNKPPNQSNAKAPFTAYRKIAWKLYQKLITSALSAIKKPINTLIINPDGILNSIPFEAFVTREYPSDTEAYYKNLDYLIKKYTIKYSSSSSLSTITVNEPKAVDSSKVGVFAPFSSFSTDTTLALDGELEEVFLKNLNSGDEESEESALRNDSLSILTFGEKEIRAIANNFSGHYYCDKASTKTKLIAEAGKFDILHIITHGKGNDSLLNKSYLSFPENTQLFVDEINTLSLKAWLVVISACESGRGKTIKGEGVYSPALGFIYTGCPNVIMTLWKVKDSTSAALIGYFYYFLAEKNSSIEKALQKAKIKYLQETKNASSHPFYWAGYVKIGLN